MGARGTYGSMAAGRVEAVAQAWGMPLELRRVVSANVHAEVFRCAAGPNRGGLPVSAGDLCLKLLRSRKEHLAHLERVLERMWGCSAAEDPAGAASRLAVPPMPPVLRAGMVALPAGDEALALLTPWVDGVTLAEAIRQEARRPSASAEGPGPLLRDALGLLVQLARTLHGLEGLAAGRAVVHGDLKPSNVVVLRDGGAAKGAGCGFRVTLIDYDTVSVEGEPTPLSRCGSFGHAAPERIAAEGADGSRRPAAAGPASDVFSFGVTAHEVLTGHWPYACPPGPGAPAREWIRFYRSLDEAPLPDASLPWDVRQLVAACLSPDPALRPLPGELVELLSDLAQAHRRDGARCRLEDADTLASIPTASPLWGGEAAAEPSGALGAPDPSDMPA